MMTSCCRWMWTHGSHRDSDRECRPAFHHRPSAGALSSNHLVMRHGNLLELLQAMEYERDRVMIGRHKGRGGCMTGMAAVFRVAALREIEDTYGEIYDPTNWAEDWKLTIALRHTRWHMIRPQDCLVSTVPVTRTPALLHQRERWARGYLQTLMQFGWTRDDSDLLAEAARLCLLDLRPVAILHHVSAAHRKSRPARGLVDASHRSCLFSGRRMDGARDGKVGDAGR